MRRNSLSPAAAHRHLRWSNSLSSSASSRDHRAAHARPGGCGKQAKWVNCQSNLRQIGYALEMYSHNWKGWIYPPMLGANRVPEERWPVHVFKPAVYDPPVMTCPADFEPRERHSYLLNDHLHLHGIDSTRAGISAGYVVGSHRDGQSVPTGRLLHEQR